MSRCRVYLVIAVGYLEHGFEVLEELVLNLMQVVYILICNVIPDGFIIFDARELRLSWWIEQVGRLLS